VATKIDMNWVEGIQRSVGNLAININALVSEIQRLELLNDRLERENVALKADSNLYQRVIAKMKVAPPEAITDEQIMCRHQWKKSRTIGGDPQEPTEYVTMCVHCSVEA
jgi:hypothetical protein